MALAVVAATTAVGWGCASPQPVAAERPQHMPTYRSLVERYNKNLLRVDRLWARAVIELSWQDEKGTHHEQGDGNLMVVLPDKAALSIGKLGHTALWAGSNENRYWLFDLRDRHEPGRLYIGTHDRMRRDEAHRWPLPVRPLDLAWLLALKPLDQPPGAEPPVGWDDGAFLIQPPEAQQRLWLDPATARPKRIDLLDRDDHPTVSCRLSRWKRMTVHGAPPGDFPWVATRLEMTVVDQEGTMTLFLSDVSDGRVRRRIKPRAFDLDHLVGVFKPGERVDLDQVE